MEDGPVNESSTGHDGESLLEALAEAGLREEEAVARPVEGGVNLTVSGTTTHYPVGGSPVHPPGPSIHEDLAQALVREGWTADRLLTALESWPGEGAGPDRLFRCPGDGTEILASASRDGWTVKNLFVPAPSPPLFLLFDIDGTLLHSSGAGRRAIHDALVETYGTAGAIDTYSFSGKLDPVIIRELMTAAGLDERTLERGLQPCLDLYADLLGTYLPERGVRVLPGVAELLTLLSKEDQVYLALCTGNVPEGARRKLAFAGLEAFFSTGAFGYDGTVRDHLPPCAFGRLQRHTLRRGLPERTVVIGDAPVDISSARASGFHSVGVLTGYHKPGELSEAEPSLLLDSFADPSPFLSFLEDLK